MHTRHIARIAILVSSTAAFGAAITDAHAQSYPAKPINFTVPFGPGTGNDVIARIIALKVNESWTQQMVVDNRP
jgi:tripartite-type tricarboxylate transporter receptor subunit TctC